MNLSEILDNAVIAVEFTGTQKQYEEECIEFLTERGYGVLPLQGREERRHLYAWIAGEEGYVAGKFDTQRRDHDESMDLHGMDDDAWWPRQILQYVDRARIFFEGARELRSTADARGDSAPRAREMELRGQQALAKGFLTFKGCVESSVRVFGKLPKPGLSSGYIEPWDDEELGDTGR